MSTKQPDPPQPGNPEDPSPADTPDSPGDSRFPAELREGVRQRDPAALTRLFEVYFPEVFDFAHRMLGERALAEDVTQEVFLKVYRHAARYDATRDPGPWIITITVNTCRDHWRSRGHRAGLKTRSIESETVGPRLAAGTLDPERATIRAQEEQRVQEALLQLPEDKRTVVLLRDYRGWSHERIAVALELTPAAVRKRYSRALQDLRPLLKDLAR